MDTEHAAASDECNVLETVASYRSSVAVHRVPQPYQMETESEDSSARSLRHSILMTSLGFSTKDFDSVSLVTIAE